MRQYLHEELTRTVIGVFYDVYNTLGYGFLEHVYAAAMECDLRESGLIVLREYGVTVRYKGIEVAHQRLDMVVDGKVVVEIKATRELHESAKRQLFNYLKATDLGVGLLLHFGPKPAVHRLYCATNLAPNRNDQVHPRNQVHLEKPA